MFLSAPDDNQFSTRLLKATNRVYARNYHHIDVLSPCKLPATGPAIVISNHISSADPFLIQSTSHRVIRWLMAKEYFDLPIVKTLCGSLGFIPVTRNGRDSTSVKAALRTLEAGNIIGLFPEGRISPTKDLLPFQSGLGMLAQRTKATVFPVAIEKFPRNLSLLESLLVPREARIFWGSPVHVGSQTASESADFHSIVQTLQQQALAVRSGECRCAG